MTPTSTSNRTQDGYSWTAASGMRKGGLLCRGVIEPSEKSTTPAGHVYDAIVIGAGYAGLMAARDMTDRGKVQVLDEVESPGYLNAIARAFGTAA